jgi:hypothetical protein
MNKLTVLWCYCVAACISATLTEVFPCFFRSCTANARVQLAKTGHGPHCSKHFCVVLCIVFVLFYVLFVCFLSLCVLFVCKCVLYYCHRVSTQLQLTNISYQIIQRTEEENLRLQSNKHNLLLMLMFKKLLKLTIKVRWRGVLLYCIYGVKYLIIFILNYPTLKMAALVRNT